jgi:hypothetical protein
MHWDIDYHRRIHTGCFTRYFVSEVVKATCCQYHPFLIWILPWFHWYSISIPVLTNIKQEYILVETHWKFASLISLKYLFHIVFVIDLVLFLDQYLTLYNLQLLPLENSLTTQRLAVIYLVVLGSTIIFLAWPICKALLVQSIKRTSEGRKEAMNKS